MKCLLTDSSYRELVSTSRRTRNLFSSDSDDSNNKDDRGKIVIEKCNC